MYSCEYFPVGGPTRKIVPVSLIIFSCRLLTHRVKVVSRSAYAELCFTWLFIRGESIEKQEPIHSLINELMQSNNDYPFHTYQVRPLYRFLKASTDGRKEFHG